MMKDKCLFCYKIIDENDLNTPAGKSGYHPKCSRKFFGSLEPPELDLTEDKIKEFAEEIIKTQRSVTGVQPKLSLEISKGENNTRRFTIVGVFGDYILKPQTEQFKNLPENEDLTMRLAEITKIKTVDHSLIRLKSGQLAYITKRVDRNKKEKFHMEDMCQLTERLTELKYKGSYEQIAKKIKQYSVNPGLDIVDLYEVVLFSFLTGNNDMHLKNFSLLKIDNEYSFCPAYDLVASQLANEEDDEELALTLNGKKNNIQRKDFEISMIRSGLDTKVIENIYNKFEKMIPKWLKFIDQSFLPENEKVRYKDLIRLKSKLLKFVIKD